MIILAIVYLLTTIASFAVATKGYEIPVFLIAISLLSAVAMSIWAIVNFV